MLDSAYLNSVGWKNQPHHPYRPRGRIMRGGQCAAALRALTAAKGYLGGQFPTLGIAANSCGTSPSYVRAGITILKANDAALIANVLSGVVPLLKAAASVKHAVDMIEAFAKSTRTERRIFGQAAGPATVFDEVVVAAL
jgi:hypothetical protein